MPFLQHSVVPIGGGDAWQGFQEKQKTEMLSSCVCFFFKWTLTLRVLTTSCVAPHPAFFFLKAGVSGIRLALPGYIAKDNLPVFTSLEGL